MALAALGGMPLVAIGHANVQGAPFIGVFSNTILDAVNEACIMVGYLWWADAASHSVTTSGSSSMQWRSGGSVLADAGTTVKVGIAGVNTTTGPPVRAVNVADVITFDVNASFVGGGGGITANAWQTSVPSTGSKTIAHGDLIAFAIQMTARGGVDEIYVATEGTLLTPSLPTVTTFNSGAYTPSTRLPNVILTASDGTKGYFYGGFVGTIGSTARTWNNASATKEYGNILRVPFAMRTYGIVVACDFAGDCDLILYSDPLGTPVVARTLSVDLNTVGAQSSQSDGRYLFSTSYDLAASTNYAVVVKPTSAINVSMSYKQFNAASDQVSEMLGTDCYAISRSTGAFAAQNSSKDRYAIGLLVGAFDAGGPAGRAVQINNDSLVA